MRFIRVNNYDLGICNNSDLGPIYCIRKKDK